MLLHAKIYMFTDICWICGYFSSQQSLLIGDRVKNGTIRKQDGKNGANLCNTCVYTHPEMDYWLPRNYFIYYLHIHTFDSYDALLTQLGTLIGKHIRKSQFDWNCWCCDGVMFASFYTYANEYQNGPQHSLTHTFTFKRFTVFYLFNDFTFIDAMQWLVLWPWTINEIST